MRVPSTARKLSRSTAGMLVALACGVGAPSCNEPLAPGVEMALVPPVLYRMWWNEVQECARRRAEFRTIRWYVGAPVDETGKELTAAWSPPGVIVLRGFYTTSEPVVKHEMLHHVTAGKLPHHHPNFEVCTRADGGTVRITLGG